MRTSSFFAPSTSANSFAQPTSPSLVLPKNDERNLSRGRILQEIFDTDGGERVFRAFGFESGKRYVSPFRTDAQHKNFSVFTDKRGRVFFKDFAASDNTAGNFLKLLELYGYRDFHAQLEFAASLYGVDSNNQRTLPHPTAETKKYPSAERHSTTQNSYRITALETAPFNDEELSVLAKLSGGYITNDILVQSVARALRSYSYNGVNKSGSSYAGTKHPHFTLVVPSADGNWYGYCYYKAATYSTFPNSAKNFHLKYHEYRSEIKFALGVDTLRPKEAAFIVEGVKDFFVAKALGLNVFTLGGVQTRLPDAVRSTLAANGNSLAICFDTDFAGFSSAQKLAETLNTQHSTLSTCICTLPRLAQQLTPDAPKPSENDLADYVCKYGFDDELRAALAVPLPLDHITLERDGIAIPAHELRITKHCAESAATIAAITNAITKTPRLFLSAPTGSGKTFCMLQSIAMQHHQRTGGRIIYVVPTIALAEQIEQEYRHLPLISITGNDTALSLLEARTSSKIIVCTADSLPKILYRKKTSDNYSTEQIPCLLDEEHLLLVVDEAHKLFSDYGYRDAAMRGVMSAIQRVGEAHSTNRVVGISATPNLLLHHAPEPVRFDYLHITAEVQPKRSLAFCPYHYREQEAVNTILREQEHGAVVVRINSEAALKTIQTLLLQHGMNAGEIDIISSRRRTTSPEYKSITKESTITRRVILTTSLLDCGVNINTTDIRAVLLFDERDPATIVQFASRFRRVEHLRILLFYKHNAHTEQQHLFPLSPVMMLKSNVFQAEMRAMEYNTFPQRGVPQIRGENLHHAVGKKSAFKAFDQSMMFDHEQKLWTPDLAGIIANLETLRNTTRTRAELRFELETYGIHIVERADLWAGTEPRSSASTMISAEAVAALKSTAQEHAKNQERIICTMLAEAPELFLEAVYHTTESRTTRHAITTLYPAIAGKPHQRRRTEECSLLLTERADLFSTSAPETFATRYMELRRRIFDHAEAITLLERFSDARAWARFGEHLAMHQRLELKRLHLHTNILTPHDQKKLERENEIRNMVANAASVGFVFHGTTGENPTRYIPFALHRAEDIAQRVNAFTDTTFRLTKQRAGELVNALFVVNYKREREVQENGTVRFGGYYTFAHDENGITRKTLADFLQETGIDGRAYHERFVAEMRRVVESKQMECKQTLCAVGVL
jgi:hypothetical protein